MTSEAAFGMLSQEDQVGRLSQLASDCLTSFGIKPTSLTPLVHAENTTFKVDSGDGEFCLRIHRPGYQSPASIRSELEWLSAIRRETDLEVPDPVPANDGEILVQAAHPDVPETRSVVLFSWLTGEIMTDGIVPHHFSRIGTVMAKLHAFSGVWNPPLCFERHRLDADHMYQEDTDEVLRQPHRFLSDEQRLQVLEIANEWRDVTRSLGKGSEHYGLIHADLHRGNVLFEGDRTKVIDFDDCGYGYLLYDFASSLAFQARADNFSECRDELLAGYPAIRSLPPHTEELLPLFMKFRLYGVIRWMLARDDNPNFRERGGDYVQAFLQMIASIDAAHR